MNQTDKQPIFITRSTSPDLAEYVACLERIFSSRAFTNNGAFVRKLEVGLEERLGVTHVAACANGTLALQLGLHAAGLAGRQVVTTPFAYVGTLSALLWEGCEVVFADIDEETCTLDPKSVAEKLTKETVGVVPVHTYGNACDVEAFDALAESARIQVLYDGSQAFGSVYRGKSLLACGDFAACSMHATRVFHAAEGGFLVCHGMDAFDAVHLMRACGHYNANHIRPGLNAKLSELHAALGCCLLDKVADNIAARKRVSEWYDALLPATNIRRPTLRQGLEWNYAYYPIIFDDETMLRRTARQLQAENIRARRYFYPALNTIDYLRQKQSCPVAERIARRALCLPLYAELEERSVAEIARIIHKSL